MLNDPAFNKVIIMALAGVCLVLLIAVIYLAFKKNTYYVDENGDEITSSKPLHPVRQELTREIPVANVKPAVKSVPQPAAPVKPASSDVKLPVSQEVVKEAAEPMAATTVLTDLEHQAFSTGSGSLDTPIREHAIEDTDISFEEIFSAAKMEDEDPKIIVSIKVNGELREQTISKLPCLIGRESAACDLVISEPAISRRHARILADGEILYLADVSEHNGTYLNGIKLPPLGKARLHVGDKINLGRAELVIRNIID